MVTQVELLADIQIFLLELPGFSQVAVADFLGLTYGLFLCLLVILRYHGLRVHPSVRLALGHVKPHAREPAHRAVHVFRLAGLDLVHLLVSLGGLVHKALHLGLEEKHPDIFLTLFLKDVIPLGDRVVIPETLAVLAVQFLHLGLLLVLRAGELLQARQRALDLETGLDHLCAAVGLDFYHFTGFLRGFLLRGGISVPGDDKSRDNG